jgi:C2H2-type zinc finger/Zinc finger, C2H2 type
MIENQRELQEFVSSADLFDVEIDCKLLKTFVIKCEVINESEMFQEIALPITTIKQENAENEDLDNVDDDNHFNDDEAESSDNKEQEIPKLDIPAVKRLNNMKIESKFYNSKDYIKLQCDLCKFKAPFQASYDDHMRYKHKGMQNFVNCKLCGKSISRSGIKSHILRTHDRRKDLGCDSCGRSFFCKQILIKHVRSHIPVELREKYVCDICSIGYSRKDNVIKHMQINHMKYKPEFVCSFCGKLYKHRKHLTMHVNWVHKNMKSFKCKYCKINFNELSKLNAHLLSNHQAEVKSETYICDICGLSFSYKKGLSKHKRQHSEAKFKCTFKGCSKGFTFNFLLAAHIRKVHDNIRQDECKFCSKLFHDKKGLEKHISMVHERVQVKCPITECPRVFHRLDYCRRHIKNDHSDLSDSLKTNLNEASRRFKVAKF